MNKDRSEAERLPPMSEGAIKTRRALDTAKLLRTAFFGMLYALSGYLLGTCPLPFGCYPLGVAWLCAAERRVPWLFVGLCLSAIGLSNPTVRILSYAAALIIRVVVRLTLDRPRKGEALSVSDRWSALFSEQLGLRMTTACVATFFVGVYRLIAYGFLYYDLYSALLALIAAPIAVLLFYGVNRAEDGTSYARTVGVLSLVCAVVYASRDLRFAYLSVSAFVAMSATLYMTKREGIVRGVLTGALCGLAYMPSMAPLFAFGALCGGFLFPLSIPLGTTAAIAAGSAWAFYVRGLGALSGLIPAILSACVLFAVVDKLFLNETKPVSDGVADEADGEKERGVACTVLSAAEMHGVRLSDTSIRVRAVCESFSSMGEIFDAMGHAMQKPSAEELRGLCDNAFDSSCASCQGRSTCWETYARQTDGEIARLSSLLFREGRVEARDVDGDLAGRCTRLPDILDEINHNASLYAARVLHSDKTEIFASDYAAIGNILAETMTSEAEEYEQDQALSERLATRLQTLSFGICGVLVWGRSQRRVAVRSMHGLLSDSQCEAVAAVIEELGGRRVTVISRERRERDGYEAIFAEQDRFSLSFARRTCRADGEEEFCGDSVGLFRREHRQYAFISDGMGAGRDAALTSGICSLFLQKMLGAGIRAETTLRMLNDFLRNKGDSLHECSATVDLMEWNLLDGSASFYKCGAAPTYVLRDGSLFKIRSKTLPIGILKEADQKKIGFTLSVGDVIVMVSDGVTQGREECPWLFDLLRQNVDAVGLEATADRIVRHAKAEGSTDDLSVLLLRVEDC